MPGRAKDPDRHENPGVLARPTKQLRDDVQAQLKAHGWTMNDFLVACLSLLLSNPAELLQQLQQFRPPPKRGRPRKQP